MRRRIRRQSKKQKVKKALDLDLKQQIHERDGWKCVVPTMYRNHGGALQAAHIFSKGRWPELRHVPENLLSICWSHHFHWAHKEPLEFTDWVRETYPDRIAKLEEMKR